MSKKRKKREIEVHRKGYDRKGYTRKNGTHVKATHVKATTYKEKDRGKPGHGKKLFEIRKGKLAPYHTGLSERKRHEILEKKIHKYGALSVFRSLNAQVVLRKHERGSGKKVFEEDKEWVKKNYLGGKRR